MKRAVSLLLAVLMLLSTASCGQQKTWEEQYDLGVRYLRDGNYREAILAFEAAIEIDPSRPEAYVSLADVYLAQEDYAGAREVLERGLEAAGGGEIEEKLQETSRLESLQNLDSLTGTDAAEAAEQLAAGGIDVQYEPVFSETVPAGEVTETATEETGDGSSVTLQVSCGSEAECRAAGDEILLGSIAYMGSAAGTADIYLFPAGTGLLMDMDGDGRTDLVAAAEDSSREYGFRFAYRTPRGIACIVHSSINNLVSLYRPAGSGGLTAVIGNRSTYSSNDTVCLLDADGPREVASSGDTHYPDEPPEHIRQIGGRDVSDAEYDSYIAGLTAEEITQFDDLASSAFTIRTGLPNAAVSVLADMMGAFAKETTIIDLNGDKFEDCILTVSGETAVSEWCSLEGSPDDWRITPDTSCGILLQTTEDGITAEICTEEEAWRYSQETCDQEAKTPADGDYYLMLSRKRFQENGEETAAVCRVFEPVTFTAEFIDSLAEGDILPVDKDIYEFDITAYKPGETSWFGKEVYNVTSYNGVFLTKEGSVWMLRNFDGLPLGRETDTVSVTFDSSSRLVYETHAGVLSSITPRTAEPARPADFFSLLQEDTGYGGPCLIQASVQNGTVTDARLDVYR